MPETELIVTIDNDDDEGGVVQMQEMETNPSKSKRARLTFPFGACRVCSDSATGIHYGIATCEGCKGFFKRSILRKEKYRCYFDSTCLVNVTNRNRCKACRFRRCIDEGMSVDGVKMGRIPKLVKERALKELKEQQMKKEAALSQTNEPNGRESSCSSLSDRSIENYDPNPMETDLIESQVSPVQRHGGLTTNFVHETSEKKLSPSISADQNSAHQPANNSKPSLDSRSGSNLKHTPAETKSLAYQTKYPTFLPEGFTVDETDGLPLESTGLLAPEIFQYVQSIGCKLTNTQSTTFMELIEEEAKFIGFLRWSTYDICIRYSKRVKQLTSRMNQMIEQNIVDYPGANATVSEFFASLQLACKVYTHATVVYVQEIPGMKNMSLKDLRKLILHRSLDYFLLKYQNLYHDNGECYLLAPNGFQLTRFWMNHLHGSELTEAIFDFCRQFRELNLSESELALVLPLHLCYSGPTMEDPETPRMLRSCYLYALYTELCDRRGEIEGKQMCSRILRVLDLLIPVNELYNKDAASRILEA